MSANESYKSTRVKKRSRLEDVIPLPTPYMIRIDPCNLCNFKCLFCPTGDPVLLESVGRPRGMMEYEFFCKIIDDLKAFDSKLKKLYFYKDGEPLLNKRLIDMIRYAKQADVAEEYWVTTNGSLLNPKMNLALIDSGLDLMRISIYGVSNEDYQRITRARGLDYKKLVENVGHLYANRKGCKIHVKLLDYGLSDTDKDSFFDDFGEICTSTHIDNLMGWSMSRTKDFALGTNSQKSPDGLDLTPKEVCPFPFYTLTINSNGTVSVCCVDWSHSTIVGDLRKESLKDVWNGDNLFEFRCMHLRKQRVKNRACVDCQYIATLPDNIDSYADEILDRLIQQREEK